MTFNHHQSTILNDWSDFWHNDIGVNVFPADTKNKITCEPWLPWQDKPISDEVHEARKKNGDYNNGIAIIPSILWRGPYAGKYLAAIDLDNKKAIEEFCRDGLEELKQKTLVEQTSNSEKIHIYFIVDREIPNKASDKTNAEILKKIEANEIPAIEVKSNGKGIMFCSCSPHKNGSNYRIIGTHKPQVFNAQDVEDRIKGICDKYGIPYGFNNNSSSTSSSYQIPIEDLWKPETKILEGHNRHLELLRIMESLLQRNRGIMSLEDIKQMAQFWNQNHCIPPLNNKEFEKQWKDALEFISSSINNNTYYYYNGNGNGHSKDCHKSNIQQRQQSGGIRGGGGGQNNNYFEYVVKSIKKTVKCEDALIRQILYTGFSTYIEDDPLNLGVLAPTSEGKTYAITESLQYFPDKDVLYIGQMSPKVLVRQKGILIDKKTGEPVGNKIQELRTKVRELKKEKNITKVKTIKAKINDEIDQVVEDIRKIYENSKTLIDLRGKILVFLEPPKHELWELLKPILSHDKKEIEFPFVDKTANSNAETKDVVVSGFPACIFCSAKDESKWEIWDEIKSRILVTSPNMVPQKYQESKKLISQRKGLPNLIQQQIIISDDEIETAKSCVLLIKQKIQELKLKSSNNNKNHKIFTWIPYRDLLDNELPGNKGTDVRFSNKVFSLLDIISIVKSDLRMVLRMEGESSIIADLKDLKEVLSITQNLDGLPKFKAEFFNKVLLPCYKNKKEPDSKIDKDTGKKTIEEEIIAVTTRELCDYFKEINKKPISTDNLKHTYLNQLINEGLVDYTPSKVHGNRQYIYYPLVTEPLSITSIMSPIDKDSQQSLTIYEKIIKNITEGWIFHEIIGLIRYRFDWGDIESIDKIEDSDKVQLIEYIKDSEKFQILDNNSNCMLDYNEEEGSMRVPISISEFIQKYYSDIVDISIDNKLSPILASFAKRSPFLSILAKIDQIDKKNNEDNTTTKNIGDDETTAAELASAETPQEGGEEQEQPEQQQEEEIIEEEKESTEEKYRREQEEIAKWDSGLV